MMKSKNKLRKWGLSSVIGFGYIVDEMIMPGKIYIRITSVIILCFKITTARID